MKTLHAKSPCCRSGVVRFGNRRRQCQSCKKTWRIRQKKRGRNPRRAYAVMANRYLDGSTGSIRHMATITRRSRSSVQRKLTQSLHCYASIHQNEWQSLIPPTVNLILIADAIWYYIGVEKYSIYVLLLRSQHGSTAVIVPPVICKGHENTEGWTKTLETLPSEIRGRIGAIVCDGGTAIIHVAYQKKWILQRCQFHLLAAFQNYLTTGPRSLRPLFARKVLSIVQRLLGTLSPTMTKRLSSQLSRIHTQSRSKGLRRTIRGLLQNLDEFQACLLYPEWNLPATSNTAESCINCIRDFLYTRRGFRSQKQLLLWLTALALHKKTLRCNAKYQPN